MAKERSKRNKKKSNKGERLNVGLIHDDTRQAGEMILSLMGFTTGIVQPILEHLEGDKEENLKLYNNIINSINTNAGLIMDVRAKIEDRKIYRTNYVMTLKDPTGLAAFYMDTSVELYKINVNVGEVMLVNLDKLMVGYEGEMKDKIQTTLTMLRDSLEHLKTVKVGG